MKDFEYNQEEHKGYYKGVLVPSITQLLSFMFPMNEMIKADTLAKASERGTAIHNEIERFNKGIINKCETQEGKNYARLMKAFKLCVVATETQVYFVKDGEIMSYGTLDQICECVGDTDFATKGTKLLLDTKTVSQFDNDKVMWQTNFYRIMSGEKIDKVGGVWVRDEKAQIRLLPTIDDVVVEEKLLELIKIWRNR